jgi:hypothetical protein
MSDAFWRGAYEIFFSSVVRHGYDGLVGRGALFWRLVISA